MNLSPIVLIAGSLLFLGCGTSSYPMHGSARVPAAEGLLEVGRGDNGNTRLTIRVQHLAIPEKLSPSDKVYVVWVTPMDCGRQPQNVGALTVDSDLTGSLSTVTPLRQFRLFITAEADPTAATPSGEQVLSVSARR